MGREQNTVGKREAAGVGKVTTPGEWGETLGVVRPPEWAPIPRGCHFPNPAASLSPTVFFAPHGGSVSPPRRPSQRWLSCRPSCRPLHPSVACLPQFLACTIATLSAGRVSTQPPLTPRPMMRCYSRSPRSIRRCRPPPAPPLPTSLVALRPLALAHAPLPPAPASNIAHRDKYVGDRTGGVVACWSLAGGSAPLGKWLRRPRIVIGDSKSRPRLLHFPQQ